MLQFFKCNVWPCRDAVFDLERKEMRGRDKRKGAQEKRGGWSTVLVTFLWLVSSACCCHGTSWTCTFLVLHVTHVVNVNTSSGRRQWSLYSVGALETDYKLQTRVLTSSVHMARVECIQCMAPIHTQTHCMCESQCCCTALLKLCLIYCYFMAMIQYSSTGPYSYLLSLNQQSFIPLINQRFQQIKCCLNDMNLISPCVAWNILDLYTNGTRLHLFFKLGVCPQV